MNQHQHQFNPIHWKEKNELIRDSTMHACMHARMHAAVARWRCLLGWLVGVPAIM
jgi:hypothetical protein